MSRSFGVVACGSLLIAVLSAPADQTWVGGTADWNLPANWNGGVVPTNESALINIGGTVQILAPSANINWLSINNSAVEINSGGNIRTYGDLDFQGSATGVLRINNGGVFTFTGNRVMTGSTLVNSGGVFNVGASDDSSWGRIGNNNATPTLFTINGGTVNAQYTEADGLVIGDYFTTSIFNMTPGSQLNMGAKRISLGWWNGGTGFLTNIGGTISFDNSAGAFWIGAGHDDGANPARGYLVLGNGASVNKIAEASPTSWGDLAVGTRWGGSADNNYGEMNMLPGSSINWQRGALVIGRGAVTTGVATNNGGTINIPNAFIGIGQEGGSGTLVLMNGATLNHGTEDFYVGDNGGAGLLVVSNATINHTANWRFAIGNNNSTGTMIVRGASSVVDTGPNEFQVGNYGGGIGTLILEDGTINTHSWTVTARDGAASGHVIINGGTMNILGDGNGGYMQVVAGVGRAGQTGTWDINGGVLNAVANSGNVEFSAWYDDNNYETFATVNLNGGVMIAGEMWGGNTGTEKHNVVNLNGGVLRLNASRTILHDLESANVRAGGAILETAGFATTVNQALLDGGGGGGLVVRGNGVMYAENDLNMVILPRYDNTFAGGVVVSNGAHLRIGDGAGNTGDGSLGLGTTILLDNGGIKNNNASTPILGAGRTITLGPGGGYFTVGWGDINMEVQSKITGAGALFVNRDGGNLVLSNTGNDYAGDTRVGADGPGRYNGGSQAGLYLGASEVIPNGAGKGNLVVDGGYGGHVNLRGFTETINGLYDVNGGLIYNDAGDATLRMGDNNAGGSYSGTIVSNINVTKIGSGEFLLGGSNTFTGKLRIEGGEIRAKSYAVGAEPAAYQADNITLDNSQLSNWEQPLVIATNKGITVVHTGYLRAGWEGGGGNLTVNSRITGTGGLGIGQDGAPVILASTLNDYAGDTTIGTTGPGWWNDNAAHTMLTLGNSEVIPHGAGAGNVVIVPDLGGAGRDAALNLNGFSETINGLSGSGRVFNATATFSTLTVGSADATSTYDGLIQNDVNLVKTGGGRLTLTGNNTYTGTTDVQGGTLRINGTHTGGGTVTVAAGATLDGTGSAGAVTIASGAHLAPGNSIGTFTVSGNLTLGGILDIELDGAGAGAADLLNVLGALDITTATVNFLVGTALDDPAYVFASYQSLNGTQFAAVSNLPSGYQIDYNYGGQNQVAVTVIPEPATLGLIAGAAVLLGLRRRRSGS